MLNLFRGTALYICMSALLAFSLAFDSADRRLLENKGRHLTINSEYYTHESLVTLITR